MEPINFTALVDAYFEAQRYTRAVAELRDYHQAKLALLETDFGFSLSVESAKPHASGQVTPEAHDRPALPSIMTSCLKRGEALFSPFGVILEGRPSPLEIALREQHEGAIGHKIHELKQAYRDCFAAALLTIAPHVAEKQARPDLFESLGPAPDPDDFW